MIWVAAGTWLAADERTDRQTFSPEGRGGAVEMRLPEPADALTGVDMFTGLESEARQRLIAAVPRSYRRGQLLFVENDPGESLIVLKRGSVAVFRTAPTGERAVLSVMRPPDVFGELSLLDGLPRSASAEALEDCSALALSRGAFMELVHTHPRILDAVMRSLGALIRRLTEQNADHVFLDLPGRVAKTLVRLAGESQAPMITIELNQSQLAEMAGGSRQSVNQAIGSFASRGWLRTEGRRIVVTDLPSLRRRAGMADR
jgi:CRP/FNR family transcriptional regulator, cyclic AMP receptor protein